MPSKTLALRIATIVSAYSDERSWSIRHQGTIANGPGQHARLARGAQYAAANLLHRTRMHGSL